MENFSNYLVKVAVFLAALDCQLSYLQNDMLLLRSKLSYNCCNSSVSRVLKSYKEITKFPLLSRCSYLLLVRVCQSSLVARYIFSADNSHNDASLRQAVGHHWAKTIGSNSFDAFRHWQSAMRACPEHAYAHSCKGISWMWWRRDNGTRRDHCF